MATKLIKLIIGSPRVDMEYQSIKSANAEIATELGYAFRTLAFTPKPAAKAAAKNAAAKKVGAKVKAVKAIGAGAPATKSAATKAFGLPREGSRRKKQGTRAATVHTSASARK